MLPLTFGAIHPTCLGALETGSKPVRPAETEDSYERDAWYRPMNIRVESSSRQCIMADMDRDDLLSLYRQMLLIRRFEEKSAEMYALAKIAGFLHLYIGEEAIAVGAIAALRPDDYVISAYRDHGHCLAGVPIRTK